MNDIYDANDIRAALARIVDKINCICVGDVQRVMTRVAERPVTHTQLQALFNLKFERQLDNIVYEVVLTHATAAEKLAPGGFRVFLDHLQHFFGGSIVGTSEALPRHASGIDLRHVVDRHSSRGGCKVASMIWEALRLAGFAGRIIIEKTTSAVPSIELVRGYTFELQQLLPFDFNFVKPRIACIDGYIESVSEVHHLLEAAAAAKEPCVVFVRGVSDDVKHTLKVNYDRGSLRVVPIAVRFDLEGMNTLVDLSIVTGTDLVSSLKGDLISSIKYEELPRIEQLTVFKGRTVVASTKTTSRVKSHVAVLKARRQDVNLVEDAGTLLDKRIKSLSPNHVIVRLPDDENFVIHSQAIDYALRAVRSAIEHGVDCDSNLVATQKAAKHHAFCCFATLQSLGAVLVSN